LLYTDSRAGPVQSRGDFQPRRFTWRRWQLPVGAGKYAIAAKLKSKEDKYTKAQARAASSMFWEKLNAQNLPSGTLVSDFG
jgi:hypothetical protein